MNEASPAGDATSQSLLVQQATWRSEGGLALHLHTECFNSATADAPRAPDCGSPGSFEVELQRSCTVLTVPVDRSILDVVRDVASETLSSWEEGFCGTCETKVLDGIPEHHDSILRPIERKKCAIMMICVGRALSARLVLDL